MQHAMTKLLVCHCLSGRP